jgi:uncharacterized protein
MTVSLANSLLPSLIRGLVVLRTYLDRIHAAAASASAAESEYLDARLADDMLPFRAQVQRATDTAKGAVARLAGISPLSLPDTDRTVGELKARVARTIAFIRSIDPSEMEGSEHMMYDQRFRGAHYAMRDQDYVDAYVLPNFYFHIAVAHAILRNKRVNVGKADYLGQIKGYAIGGSDTLEGRLRFLSFEQSAAWLTAYDMRDDSQLDALDGSGVSFAADVASILPSALIASILGPERVLPTPVMVRFTTWTWDDEYEKDPTAEYRLAQGDSRPLLAVPGWVFPPDRVEDLRLILSLAIERRWTASLYLTDHRTTVRLIDDARIEVYASDPEVGDAIRRRLTGLGAFCGPCRLPDLLH